MQVSLLYAQVEGYRNMLKLSSRPLVFTLSQAFLKKQKDAWNYSLCIPSASFSARFLKKNISQVIFY